MSENAFPKLKPFVSAFFQPICGVTHQERVVALKPFMDFDTRFPNLVQLNHSNTVMGLGFNHDHMVHMQKNEHVENDAVDTLIRASNFLKRQGVPQGDFRLGGVLPVQPFYHREDIPMGNYLDLPHDRRQSIGLTIVLSAIRMTVAQMVLDAGISESDYPKIEVIVGTEPSLAKFVESTAVFFDEAPLSHLHLKVVTTLNVQVRNRMFVTLGLKKGQVFGIPPSFGAILHLPDEVTPEVRLGEDVLFYHSINKATAIIPILADIRLLMDK
jgi:hypothetical protein